MGAGNREYRDKSGQPVQAMRITGANADAICQFSGGALTHKLILSVASPDDFSAARRSFSLRGEPILIGDWIVKTVEDKIHVVEHRDFADNHIPIR